MSFVETWQALEGAAVEGVAEEVAAGCLTEALHDVLFSSNDLSLVVRLRYEYNVLVIFLDWPSQSSNSGISSSTSSHPSSSCRSAAPSSAPSAPSCKATSPSIRSQTWPSGSRGRCIAVIVSQFYPPQPPGPSSRRCNPIYIPKPPVLPPPLPKPPRRPLLFPNRHQHPIPSPLLRTLPPSSHPPLLPPRTPHRRRRRSILMPLSRRLSSLASLNWIESPPLLSPQVQELLLQDVSLPISMR